MALVGLTSSAQAACGRGAWIGPFVSGDSYCTSSNGMIGRARVDDELFTTVENYHTGLPQPNTGVGLEYEMSLFGRREFVPMLDRATGLPLLAAYEGTASNLAEWPFFVALQPYVLTGRFRAVCLTTLSGLLDN